MSVCDTGRASKCLLFPFVHKKEKFFKSKDAGNNHANQQFTIPKKTKLQLGELTNKCLHICFGLLKLEKWQSGKMQSMTTDWLARFGKMP